MCPNNDCSKTAPAGSARNTVNQAPARACSGASFCDDRLEGLPFSSGGTNLVGVPDGEKCLHRVGSPTGVWQHDESRADGPDFVGPLVSPAFVPPASIGAGECGFIASLRVVGTDDDGNSLVQVAKQDVVTKSYGNLSILTQCEGGKARIDEMVPVEYDPSNPCEANFTLLGYVQRIVIENGVSKLQKVWKAFTRLFWPDGQITKFPDFNDSDPTQRRLIAKQTPAGCWEFGLAPVVPPDADCSSYTSTGESFDFLLACDGGDTKKVEAVNGKILKGVDGKWKAVTASSPVSTPTLLTSWGGYTTPVNTSPTLTFETTLTPPEGATSVVLFLKGYLATGDGGDNTERTVEMTVEGFNYMTLKTQGGDRCTNSFQLEIPLPTDNKLTVTRTWAGDATDTFLFLEVYSMGYK